MIESIGLYVVVYLLLALCLIYPPTEFTQAGLTLENLLQFFLGVESNSFIFYHIRRTSALAFVHSLLPLVFFAGIQLVEPDTNVFLTAWNGPSLLWKFIFAASVLLPLLVGTYIYFFWYMNDWTGHPVVQLLIAHDQDWNNVRAEIDREFRSFDKFSVVLGGVKRMVVTENWIMVTSLHSVNISHQSDVRLSIAHADEHAVSHHSEIGGVQFLNIKVENLSKPIEPFLLRLRSSDYSDLQTKLHRPVEAAHELVIKQTIAEEFVDHFVAAVRENERAALGIDALNNRDQCMGCMQIKSNCKLVKSCQDPPAPEEGEEPIPPCGRCYCRPMWCIRCLARWFASRQDQHTPELWLEGKSPCPTCRTIFCILDVRLAVGPDGVDLD